MAFAETANLAVKLTLGGNFTSQMSKATSSLGKFNKESRGFKAGAQIGTGIKRSAFIAVAALGTLTGALAVAIKDGQEAARVQQIYAKAISNSGKVSADYAKLLNAQQTALMNLAGVDDELIKTEQTRLIQMGLTGKAVAKLTPLILDASKATGKDLLTVTVAAGKAANGNATALQRLGIMVDKVRFKADPLAETMRVLNERFGGTTKALSGNFDVRMAALRENLKNIGEDAGQKLLPALTRIVSVVGTKLVPAFGKFVDRILPDITKGLDSFASALEDGGAENAIRGITDALGPMIDLVKIAAEPVKAITKAFLSLPKEVQTVLVGAFAVNKLTGGLVTNAAGGIIGAITKGLLGGIKAPLVNVTGGVVNVGGGVGGGLPAAGAAGAGALTTGLALTTAVVAPLAVAAAAKIIQDQVDVQGSSVLDQTKGFAGKASDADLAKSIDGLRTQLDSMQFNTFDSKNKVVAVLNTLIAEQNRRNTTDRPLTTGPNGASDKQLAHIERSTNKTNSAIEKIRQNIIPSLGTHIPSKLEVAANAATVAGITAALASKRAGDDTKAAVASGAMSMSGAAKEAGRNTTSAVHSTAGQIVAGFAANRPIVSVAVNVTATQVTKSVTIQNRYGPGGGSASQNIRQGAD